MNRKVWISEQKDSEGNLIERVRVSIYETSDGRRVADVEDLLDAIDDYENEDDEDSAAEPKKRSLIISDFTKPEFRKEVAKRIGGNPPIDKVNIAIRKSIRIMRKTEGGLMYTEKYIKIAIDKYNSNAE